MAMVDATRELELRSPTRSATKLVSRLCFALYTPEGDSIALSTGITVHVHTMSDVHEDRRERRARALAPDPLLMLEIFPRMGHADPDWQELRELTCPSCARQLEVEAAAPGYPLVHDFLPDVEGFYSGWLGRPLPSVGSSPARPAAPPPSASAGRHPLP